MKNHISVIKTVHSEINSANQNVYKLKYYWFNFEVISSWNLFNFIGQYEQLCSKITNQSACFKDKSFTFKLSLCFQLYIVKKGGQLCRRKKKMTKTNHQSIVLSSIVVLDGHTRSLPIYNDIYDGQIELIDDKWFVYLNVVSINALIITARDQ